VAAAAALLVVARCRRELPFVCWLVRSFDDPSYYLPGDLIFGREEAVAASSYCGNADDGGQGPVNKQRIAVVNIIS